MVSLDVWIFSPSENGGFYNKGGVSWRRFDWLEGLWSLGKSFPYFHSTDLYPCDLTLALMLRITKMNA
jgi:hypothetical protein